MINKKPNKQKTLKNSVTLSHKRLTINHNVIIYNILEKSML